MTGEFDALVSRVMPQIGDEISKNVSHVMDASTQTDKKFEYCFQCHHHHVIVKNLASIYEEDIKSMAINHMTSKSKCTEKECASATVIGGRNVCVESREPMKLEDRPKWGVNRPLQQYIKASGRDQFYLRNKRKKHQKRHEDQNRNGDDNGSKKDSSMAESQSTSRSPSIITNSTVIAFTPKLFPFPRIKMDTSI